VDDVPENLGFLSRGGGASYDRRVFSLASDVVFRPVADQIAARNRRLRRGAPTAVREKNTVQGAVGLGKRPPGQAGRCRVGSPTPFACRGGLGCT